jgi:hypothetical protein
MRMNTTLDPRNGSRTALSSATAPQAWWYRPPRRELLRISRDDRLGGLLEDRYNNGLEWRLFTPSCRKQDRKAHSPCHQTLKDTPSSTCAFRKRSERFKIRGNCLTMTKAIPCDYSEGISVNYGQMTLLSIPVLSLRLQFSNTIALPIVVKYNMRRQPIDFLPGPPRREHILLLGVGATAFASSIPNSQAQIFCF